MKANKVKLRFYRDTDLEFLHGLLSDEATKKYFPFMYTEGKDQSELSLRSRMQDQEWGIDTRYLIEDAIRKKAVGEISGRPAKDDDTCMELAIMIHPDFRGQGFAKDGILKFIEKMRKIKPSVTRFRMQISENNKESQSVAKKLDFKLKSHEEPKSSEKEQLQCWENK